MSLANDMKPRTLSWAIIRPALTCMALVGCAKAISPLPVDSSDAAETVAPDTQSADAPDLGVDALMYDTAEVASDVASADANPLVDWADWGVSACDDATTTGATLGAVAWQSEIATGERSLLLTDGCTVAAWGSKALTVRDTSSGNAVAEVVKGFAAVGWAPGRRMFTAMPGDNAELAVINPKDGTSLTLGLLGGSVAFPSSLVFGATTDDFVFASRFQSLVGRHGSSIWAIQIIPCYGFRPLLEDNRPPTLLITTNVGSSGFFSCGYAKQDGKEGALRNIRRFADGKPAVTFAEFSVADGLSPYYPYDTCVGVWPSVLACAAASYVSGDLTARLPSAAEVMERVDSVTGTVGAWAFSGKSPTGRGIGLFEKEHVLVTASGRDSVTVQYSDYSSPDAFEMGKVVSSFEGACPTPRNPYLPLPVGSTGAAFLACPTEIQRYTAAGGLTWTWKVPTGTIRDIAVAGDKTCVIIEDSVKTSLVCLK